MDKASSSRIQFGPFEADLEAGELFRQGRRVALQQQPFAVLRILASRPGEVVTREELRKALWPGDTFVDFEAGLNAAIKRVRRALDDDADNPRFISTLPRRGYSFIAPVARPEESAPIAPRPADGGKSRIALWGLMAGLAGLGLMGYVFRPVLAIPAVKGAVALTAPMAIPDNQNLVTDGPSIFFVRLEAGGQRELVKVPSSGGTVVPLELPAEFHGTTRLLDISSDGSEILARVGYVGASPLWAIPAEGGAPKRLGNLEATDAAWLPDATGIIFARGNNLYISSRSGDQVRLLTRTPGEPMEPRWSPDHRELRFSVYDHGRNQGQVWTYDLGTRQATPLQPRESVNAAGTWTEDGQFYVFGSASKPGVLWARRESVPVWWRRPSSAAMLTTGPLSYASPIESRDHNHLFAIGTLNRGELVRVGAGLNPWQPYLDGRSADALTFSHDGRWIAYITYPESALWRVNRKTGERLQLVNGPGRSLMPEWSPDGRSIQFTEELGNQWRLMRVTGDGSHVEALTPADLDAGQATWAPSGQQLALVYRHIPKDEPQRLGVLDVGSRKITEIPGSLGWGYPQWSPDGQMLLARRPGAHGLAVYSFRARSWREIPAPPNVSFPLWSSDGHSIVFNTLGTDRPGIYRIRWMGSETAMRFAPPEMLSDLRGFVPAGTYGYWSGMDPEGGFLLMRDVGWSAIYRLNWQP